MRNERTEHTLQPTALVHEAYMKLADQDRVEWQGRTHFLAVGAQAMRRILVDHARGRGRTKRGADWYRVPLFEEIVPSSRRDLDAAALVDLDRALDRLAAEAPRQARVVELRFFAGLEVAEVAEILGVSKRTVEGDWAKARDRLRAVLATSAGDA
jgi:RNA polymerase sigma factor (TIGR02999 family)